MQVVVDAIPPQCLVSACATREFDFQTIKEEDLHDFTVPLDLPVGRGLLYALAARVSPERKSAVGSTLLLFALSTQVYNRMLGAAATHVQS